MFTLPFHRDNNFDRTISDASTLIVSKRRHVCVFTSNFLLTSHTAPVYLPTNLDALFVLAAKKRIKFFSATRCEHQTSLVHYWR